MEVASGEWEVIIRSKGLWSWAIRPGWALRLLHNRAMTDPSVEAFFKWASGLLFIAGGLLTAITRDFGLKQSQIATGWPAFAVGIAMTCAGFAIIAICIRDSRNRETKW